MKTLNEYLNANVKLNDDFQKFTTRKEVCDFLEKKGFKEIIFYSYMYLDDIYKKMKESDEPLYFTGQFNSLNSFGSWVRFGNCGKDDTVFFWRIKEISNGASNYNKSDYDGDDIQVFKTFEEFKEYVKNYFGW